MKNNYCVIMAGGIGSRFWPMSRTSFPKQFHDVLGIGKTLIQLTYDRFLSICPKENILVVTNEDYKELVLEQLPDLTEQQVLCEPHRRNTAPCIAYASYKINAINPDANIIVAPSDHLILKEDIFIETIQLGLKQAQERDCLLTLGIKPSRPDTGYGYIQFIDDNSTINNTIKKVKTFTEKPNHELALQFIESGDFYWNSGIFVWTVKNIMEAFDELLPEVNSIFKDGIGKYNTPEESAFIDQAYQICTNISVDYGIMEKAKNVFVVLSDFGWSDLGTWGSLYMHIDKDQEQNAITGKNVMMYESSNCMVNINTNKTAVIQGLDDYIVVDSDNVLLIVKKKEEQQIKKFVNDVKIEKGDSFI